MHCAVWTRKIPAQDRTKKEQKRASHRSLVEWSDSQAALCFAMGENIIYDLPLKFPGRNTLAFPNPWPNRCLPGRGRTPERGSVQWKAVIDFRESSDWDDGDLQKFANYFGVRHSSLSKKIKASREERRHRLAQAFHDAPVQAHGDDAELQTQGATPNTTFFSATSSSGSFLCGRRGARVLRGAPIQAYCDDAELPPSPKECWEPPVHRGRRWGGV